MSYVLAPQGKVVAYPYSFEHLRRDNPDVSFPREIDDKLLAEWGVYPVSTTVSPLPSSLRKDVVDGTPFLIDGVWVQSWREVDATAEHIAARQRGDAEIAIRTEVKADTFVSSFLAMTPAQVIAHIDATPNTAAGMKALTTKLALMVLVLMKREFRHE